MMPAPAWVFDLHATGADTERLRRDLRDSFHDVAWDLYDVRRLQIARLHTHLRGNFPDNSVSALSFYSGEVSLAELLDEFAVRDPELFAELQNIRPFRRRSVARYARCEKGGSLHNILCEKIRQRVVATDIRSVERKFQRTAPAVAQHPDVLTFIEAVLSVIDELEPQAKEYEVTLWHNQLFVYPGAESTNSPEGVHQDGADYIISALVLERHNILGGVSRIFDSDKQRVLLEYELQPGEAILQADNNSPLWHDVTPVTVLDVEKGMGWRNTLGLDINVLRNE